MVTAVFIFIFATRLVSLAISVRNEKRLIAAGAKQFGEKNSKLLATAHIIYYFSALAEAYICGTVFDGISAAGTAIAVFALAMLFYVIRALGEIWTLKIYIHPQHQINRSWLFRHVRHPNYFLNIIPELIGVGLLCHAWTTMIVGLPAYLMVLGVRIRQEHEAMRHLW